MRIPERAAVPRRVRALGLAAVYAAVALLATAFFFFLHDLGNRLPRELAQQRFRAEFEAGRPDEGQARGYKTDFEYCEMSETVLAGARGGWRSPRAEEGRAFFNSVVLSTFATVPGKDYCHELRAAVNGAEVGDEIPPGYIRSRYWWGSKALYAIALRYLSVREIRELTLTATRAAYLLLAVVLVAFAPRTLPATAPLLVLGAFSSGLEYWADVANGTPYLWTVSSAAVLAGLLRGRRPSGVFSGAVPLWCFAAGTVSSYLWLGDGHTFLAATWIGLLVWFGGGAPGAAERTRRAVSCIALYAAGFVACHGLGQIVKAVVWDYERMWGHWYRGVGKVVNASVADVSTEGHLSTYLESFYAMAWPGWLPAGVFPTTAAASSLAVAAGFVVFRRRGGAREPLRGIPWIVVLLAVNSLSFLIGEHYPYRTARFVFVPLALCCSCLILCVRATDWKLSSAVLGTVLVVSGSVSWYFDSFDARAAGRLIASVEDVRPFVSAGFDVHLDGDRLVYVKEDCGDEDVVAAFFLHLYPVDEADLPEHRRRHGFDNLDFAFEKYGFRGGGRCAAARDLPEYRIASIHTGQYVFGQDPEWSGRVRPTDSRTIDDLFASVEDARPVISSGFDAYLDGDRLVYVKEDCGDEDVVAAFFLHLYPVDEADLPEHRRRHGFDNLDFAFEKYGFRGGGRCAAARFLPDYGIAGIHTGQYMPGRDPEWSGRVSSSVFRSAAADSRAIDELIASVEDARPVVRGGFDVYLDGDRLVYVKDDCGDGDVDARFFLHVYPVDEADLPDSREPHGFDNLDFAFERYGLRAGGRCAAARVLPEYEVASVHTGQFVPGRDPDWDERVYLDQPDVDR